MISGQTCELISERVTVGPKSHLGLKRIGDLYPSMDNVAQTSFQVAGNTILVQHFMIRMRVDPSRAAPFRFHIRPGVWMHELVLDKFYKA